MAESKQPGVHLTSIDEEKPVNQPQKDQIIVPVSAPQRPPPPTLPLRTLLDGNRERYINVGIPLYEASTKGDWKAAKGILDKDPDLVRCSITENCETALHIAASADKSKRMQDFVNNLVERMTKQDLELQNNTSKGLRDDGWNPQNRGWLLQKCVEANLFDIA